MGIDFDDKVILVTGSSRGLGLSFAKCLDQAGAKVALNGRAPYSEELAKNFQEAGIESYYISCPAESSEDLISQVIDKFGRIDGLVHNAGFLRDKTLKKIIGKKNTNPKNHVIKLIMILFIIKYFFLINLSRILQQNLPKVRLLIHLQMIHLRQSFEGLFEKLRKEGLLFLFQGHHLLLLKFLRKRPKRKLSQVKL